MYLKHAGLPLANSLTNESAQVEIVVLNLRSSSKMAELSVRTTTNARDQKWRGQRGRTITEPSLF